MSDKKLQENFQFYLDHQGELVKKYNGKTLMIQNCEVIEVFDSYETAYQETVKRGLLGKVLLQICSPGHDDYTATFNSRVSFAS